MFIVRNLYTKKDIYKLLNVPESKQNGNWNTGYTTYENNIYIFCNVGVAGRTGHDYNNHWIDETLIWYGKNGSKISHPLVKRLLDPSSNVFIFTRTDSSLPFNYEGRGYIKDYKEDSTPIEITWTFKKELLSNWPILPEEINPTLYEGASITITVNKHERNYTARQKCIEHFGCQCQICGFDFEKAYGEVGKNFIHVHHLNPLAGIQSEYAIDPILELIPICPNCHAVIHKRDPCYTIAEMKFFLLHNKNEFLQV